MTRRAGRDCGKPAAKLPPGETLTKHVTASGTLFVKLVRDGVEAARVYAYHSGRESPDLAWTVPPGSLTEAEREVVQSTLYGWYARTFLRSVAGRGSAGDRSTEGKGDAVATYRLHHIYPYEGPGF